MSTKINIFGKYQDLIVKNRIGHEYYKYNEETNQLEIYENDLANLDLTIKFVYQSLFIKYVLPIFSEKVKEIPNAGFNKIKFLKNGKFILKTKYKNNEENLNNVKTSTKCEKCGVLMILKINEKKGTKFLACPRYPVCKSTQFIETNKNQKSKNGYYIYAGPTICKLSFEKIECSIIISLICTYKKYKSVEFWLELAKYCPEYWIIENQDINNTDLLIAKIKDDLKSMKIVDPVEINKIINAFDTQHPDEQIPIF